MSENIDWIFDGRPEWREPIAEDITPTIGFSLHDFDIPIPTPTTRRERRYIKKNAVVKFNPTITKRNDAVVAFMRGREVFKNAYKIQNTELFPHDPNCAFTYIEFYLSEEP